MIDRTPILLLAELPPPLQARLDAVRRTHYPQAKTPAHLTLFHAIPGMIAAELADILRECTRAKPPRATIARVIDWQEATALAVHSEDLVLLRETIASRLTGLLTAADALPPALHITIQNKALRPAAIALQRTLAQTWHPTETTIPALTAHRVIAGQWHPIGRWPFRGQPPR